jgi:hypothetical protein
MDAIGFQRPALAKIFNAGWVTAIIACFAIGQAQAQFVNPVPTAPPPTFNPSSPSTVPQPPETPISPGPPSGLPGSTPPSNFNESAPVPAKSRLSRAHVSHHGQLRHHWSRRHGRAYAARVIGPSYYPGLGVIYPPYPDPCHFSRVWHGYWMGYWMYTCS